MINEFSEEDIRRLKELVDSSKTERFMVGHILKKRTILMKNKTNKGPE